MNRTDLESKIKPTVTIYLSWFLFGSHYAFLGKWNTQILFWITLGGLGIWAIVDLVTMYDKIVKHREMIFQKIDEIEKEERLGKRAQYKIKSTSGYKLAMVG